MPITVDELMESATSGVLRALSARGNGDAKPQTQDATALVQSGFNVEFHIRAGGIRIGNLSELNPQPLPPFDGGGLRE